MACPVTFYHSMMYVPVPTAQVIRAHKTAGDDKEETADTKAMLQADTGYQAFRSEIAAHRIDDHMAIASRGCGWLSECDGSRIWERRENRKRRVFIR